MHPAIHQELIKTRVADLHNQAKRHALAASASKADWPQPSRGVPVRTPASLARRVAWALGHAR